VLINYYRDGSDSIAWHCDKDGAASTIASFSLGAERDFLIRARPPRGQTSVKGLESHKLPLADGSLLLMLPGMQDKYHHSLPARKGLSRGRINVTFRSHGRTQSGPQKVVKI
jgi:alkylated DNA repair dioxygenase AlkB